jgi:hypothetical protein
MNIWPALAIVGCTAAASLGLGLSPAVLWHSPGRRADESLLENHLLVTWYGNPHSSQMGVLGQWEGAERASRLQRQAAAYAPLTKKHVLPAYHLVAVVAQTSAERDGKWRRRESYDVIASILEEARSHGFLLVLDVQPGRAAVEDELAYLKPFLLEPDVHLALDPEFDMSEGQRPGRDKEKIRTRRRIDLVLDMDGFGSQSLKLASYRTVMRQCALPFAGFKLVGFGDMLLGIISMNDILLATGPDGPVRSEEVVDTLHAICRHHKPVPHVVAA